MTGPVDHPELSLEQVDAVRRRVLNVVGHELRTPITALSGLAAQLPTAEPDEIRTRLAPAIERLAHRTEALLDELLLAAGVTTALPVDVAVPVPLAATVESAWKGLGEVTTGHRLEVEGSTDLEASAGHETVRRVLEHLLRNAAAYGGDTVTAHIDDAGGRAVCEIVNTASVVKDEELTLAFEPFYRGEHAVMRVAGLGLGLTVARALARHAGGDVDLRRRGPDQVAAVLTLPTT